ncbi:MAG: aminomethyl-transferring glycine dehydrogenase subunit GcvPA [Alloprevotella sp.]|nr:aminomethyl-transferring glycine dehydrogenase subunit GcvPA [Bacteroidales bacterium]MCI7167460.1 aminomethyl-transferring glycine dehydrogenase subunit GcvPA [Bacteroidales bacterium]MDD6501422.1 aminomethyl-transferring glycine dehydrogenase subunit GcvPA [Bacteroidales bacterium]MDY4564446.1 aminomethyl-transferring glycine dehydrogenase subunit GcvPA [Alloprevotella sp.]
MKYIPHTPDDIRAMLDVIGVSSLEDLYAEVPEELKLHRELDIPQSKSEIEVRRIIRAMADKNRKLVPFAGAGVYDHYVPSMIPYITSRSEFSTSYTPYQAEISQGTLQYIFEYQTMMADLTGMDISNASMYDGSTATAEAMLMCVAAAKKRNKVLISATFNPRVLNVVRTYAKFHGVELVEIPAADGLTDREAITRELAAGDVAGVMVAQPNHYGIIEDFTGLADEVHAAKALLVINSIASTLAVLRSPGEWGADIACGDAQSLGIPMNFGGPHIGYLCVKSALVRKMPGRLVGETVDADGKRAFVLTMQAREQHIRREKATSNICTAQGIMCLYVAIYLSIMGRQGLVEVNEQSAGAARALREALLATGKFEEVFPGKPFLNEFALRYVGSESLETLRRRWAENGWLGGVTLDGMPNCLLFAATEQRTQEEIDAFAALV